METAVLTFFPFPSLLNGVRRDGFSHPTPTPCLHCDRQCEKSAASSISLCSYGVNFSWFTSDLLVFGIVVTDDSATSTAKVKVARKHPTSHVLKSAVEQARTAWRSLRQQQVSTLAQQTEALIDDYKRSERYKEDFLARLRPEIQRAFAHFHDYRQFIVRIKQQVNVILEERYPVGDISAKLAAARPAEKAIYWATQLMDEKLRTAYFLLNPDEISDPRKGTVFRFHGLVIKYIRIYQPAFDEKGIALTVVGESHGEIRGHSTALAVIPHTFLDNALKYSPRHSSVQVVFRETEGAIEFSVTSFGPQIGAAEREQIFDLFYRGAAARKQEEEGAGFGLYLARFIARQLGTDIRVEQDPTPQANGSYRTRFSVTFQRER